MPPYVATTLCAVFVMGLFWLDRGKTTGTSAALWIPVIWLSLAASRSVSQWLDWAPSTMSNDLLLEGNPVDRIVYAALVAAGLVVLVTRAKRVGKLLRANGPVLIFFLYCGASLLWSDFPDVAFKRWFKAIGDLVMVLVIWTEVDPTTAVGRLLKRAAYLLMPLSIVLIQYSPKLGRT
jgi:exopolysaccharide production protein ExoQ